jgi:hypothetical protein
MEWDLDLWLRVERGARELFGAMCMYFVVVIFAGAYVVGERDGIVYVDAL